MKTKLKISLISKLPRFIAKWCKVTAVVNDAGTEAKFEVRRGHAINWYTYLNERIETYSYYDSVGFRFAEVILSDARRAGRMLAIADANRIVFVQPFINSIAFLRKAWDEVVVDDVVELDWIGLDQADAVMLNIESNKFETLDFEDFISQNPNLTAENLGFLFLKYSV